ncbi:MAG TPA: helix-turn-helix domain-containing protein [Steroidobacteraceae bacterium]|nr:helix-turn-helix domain-containing protein [Steroidobacteraceae bacterium]
MTERPARIRRNDPQGLRARILDSAARLFQERGYHATGMRDVMQDTGVSSGALHHHFPTKDALALAVITDRIGPIVRAAWIDPVRRGPSLGKAVAQVFTDITRGIEERGAVTGCPLNNLAMELSFSSPQLRAPLEAIFQEWQSVLADRIGETSAGARLDRRKRAAAATFIIAAYSGAMNLAKTTQSASPLRTAASNLAVWLSERSFAT